MELFGLQFAPLNIPLERRLQTLAAGVWFVVMVFGGFVMCFVTLYLILFTRFWWLTILYICWYKFIDKDTCERGGRRSNWVRNLTFWKYLRNYFPLNFERVPWMELEAEKNYLFCCFPHGMLCAGPFGAFGSPYGGFYSYFPNHEPYVMTLGQHFEMPFFREFILGLGGCKASSKSIEYMLNKEGGGHAVILMVGGASEAFYCRPGKYKIIYNKRKGFVRCAMKTGTPLVPVFSFGETDLFDQIENPEGSFLRTLQEWLKRYIGIAPAIPVGRGFFQYTFGLVPKRKPVTTVVGHPVRVEKNLNPTQEQIDEVHEKFREALIKLFEEQKYTYLNDPENTKLEII